MFFFSSVCVLPLCALRRFQKDWRRKSSLSSSSSSSSSFEFLYQERYTTASEVVSRRRGYNGFTTVVLPHSEWRVRYVNAQRGEKVSLLSALKVQEPTTQKKQTTTTTSAKIPFSSFGALLRLLLFSSSSRLLPSTKLLESAIEMCKK